MWIHTFQLPFPFSSCRNDTPQIQVKVLLAPVKQICQISKECNQLETNAQVARRCIDVLRGETNKSSPMSVRTMLPVEYNNAKRLKVLEKEEKEQQQER